MLSWVIWCFVSVAFNNGCVLHFYTILHGEKIWEIISTSFLVAQRSIKNTKKGYRPQENWER